MNSHDVVKVVTRQLEINETIFLNPAGYDDECDNARVNLTQFH